MAGMYTEAYSNLLNYIHQLKAAESGEAYEIDEKTNEDCIAYQQNLNKLVTITKELYEGDGFGNLKSMTKEQFDNLMEAYEGCIRQSDKLAANPASPYNTGVIHNIQNLLSKDYAYLNMIDKNNLVPLPVAMEQARGRVIEIGGVNIQSVGGQANSRKAVSLVDENGNAVNGFFTVEKPILYGEKMQEIARERIRIFKESVSADWFKGDSESVRADLSPEENAEQFKMAVDELASEPDWGISLIYRNDLDEMDPNLRKYYHLLSDLYIERQIYEENLQIPVQEYEKNGMTVNADTRNIAMSAVANLIGAPDAVARSYSITAKDGDKLIRGTFMENIEGVNRNRVEPDHPIFELDGSEIRRDGHILKRLADIQILDYICQNVDRHGGNIMYVMGQDDSGRPKLLDIKGIDNDASFGVREVANDEKINNNTAFDHLKVISQSVCDKVMSLDKSMLTATLKGYGLVDSEIDAAWKRTQNLQARITESMAKLKDDKTYSLQEGYIRVVPDEEFGKLDFEQLMDPGLQNKGANLFTEVEAFLRYGKKWAQKNQKKDINKLEFAQVSVMDGNVESLMTPMNASFNAFYDKLRGSEGTIFTHGGNEYKEMRNALANVIHIQNDMTANESGIDSNQIKYIASLEILKEKCKKYMDYKQPKIKDIKTPGERAKSRLEVADNIYHSIDGMLQSFRLSLSKRDDEMMRVQMANVKHFGKKANEIKDIVSNQDFGQKDMETVKKNMAEMVANQLVIQEVHIGKSKGVRSALATNRDGFLKNIMENEGFTSVFNELGTDGVKNLFVDSDGRQVKSTIRNVIDKMTEKAREHSEKTKIQQNVVKTKTAPVEKKKTEPVMN